MTAAPLQCDETDQSLNTAERWVQEKQWYDCVVVCEGRCLKVAEGCGLQKDGKITEDIECGV